MNPSRDYLDIPGTYVMDPAHSRKGYQMNMLFMSLNDAENRERFRSDQNAYLDDFKISSAQRQAIVDRNWLEMLRLGGNIYYTFKLAIFDGLSMQQAGALMSGTGMSEEDFKQMMLDGGRPIEGNRSKTQNEKIKDKGGKQLRG